MNKDNKKELTSQEWEIQRKEKNQALWANRKSDGLNGKKIILKRLKLTPY